MKSVLLIANFRPGFGGISSQIELLRGFLKSEDIVVSVFNTKKSLFCRLFLVPRLLCVGRNFKVFHIHCCSDFGFLPAVIGILVGRILRKHIVVTYHGGEANLFFDKYPTIVRFFLLKSNVNIVLSGFIEKTFIRHNIPCTIIPNVIDLRQDVFKERPILKPRFISVRTLSSLYNVDFIIKAFYYIKEKYPQATLSILGDGPMESQLRELVKEKEIKGVSFIGRIQNNEVYKYLSEADIMISSPRIDNMPVSVLEAFNAGVLVISSCVGGVPYMIQSNNNGLLFELNNMQHLIDCVDCAISDPDNSIKMIRNAHKSLEKYTWCNIKKLLFEVYKF